jgi:hypothetical protein
MENLPDEKEVVDIIAKSGYLKVEDENLKITLESHNTVNIQPKGTIFGAKIKVDDNKVTPTLTFDTRKLNQPKKNINPKDIVDEALNDFWENQV